MTPSRTAFKNVFSSHSISTITMRASGSEVRILEMRVALENAKPLESRTRIPGILATISSTTAGEYELAPTTRMSPFLASKRTSASRSRRFSASRNTSALSFEVIQIPLRREQTQSAFGDISSPLETFRENKVVYKMEDMTRVFSNHREGWKSWKTNLADRK